MKQKTLLFTAFAGIMYLSLSSYRSGPAANSQGDRTGRTGPTCAASGCHTASANTSCAIEVRKKSNPTGPLVTSYTQDSVYIVRVKGTNSSLPQFGFQVIAVSGNSAAGTWQNLPATVHISTAIGIPLVEQSNAIAKDGSGNYVIDLEWKASSSAAVKFQGIINAINNDGTSGGDATSSTATTTLQNASSVETVSNDIAIRLFPNPVSNTLHVAIAHATTGAYDITAYDMRGKILTTQTAQATGGVLEAGINSSRWAAGMYFIQVSNGDSRRIIPVVKN